VSVKIIKFIIVGLFLFPIVGIAATLHLDLTAHGYNSVTGGEASSRVTWDIGYLEYGNSITLDENIATVVSAFASSYYVLFTGEFDEGQPIEPEFSNSFGESALDSASFNLNVYADGSHSLDSFNLSFINLIGSLSLSPTDGSIFNEACSQYQAFAGQCDAFLDYVKFKSEITYDIAAVPVPAAVWLMGSGLIGLLGFQRRNKKTA